MKDIDNWFVNVRKRIGWNRLRSKYYENKRSKIVCAATRFFKEVPQTLPITTHISGTDPMANHDSEFKAIENRAKELYSEQPYEPSLASKPDDVVRDLTPETKARAQNEEKHRRPVAKSRRGKKRQHPSAYPSPEQSPERLAEPSPERSPESLATSLPIPDVALATSLKRRNCDRDSPELDIEHRRDEPQKRSRYFFFFFNLHQFYRCHS